MFSRWEYFEPSDTLSNLVFFYEKRKGYLASKMWLQSITRLESTGPEDEWCDS